MRNLGDNMIKYTEEIKPTQDELKDLFLSVNWNSGKFPDRLYKSIENSSYKIFAYDEDKLVGLASGLSDGCINLFISYLLVDPQYKGQNIGTELLNRITSKKNFNRIQLITEESCKDFYLKNGFIQDGVGMFKIKW